MKTVTEIETEKGKSEFRSQNSELTETEIRRASVDD
jgi:hypothetical protein